MTARTDNENRIRLRGIRNFTSTTLVVLALVSGASVSAHERALTGAAWKVVQVPGTSTLTSYGGTTYIPLPTRCTKRQARRGKCTR